MSTGAWPAPERVSNPRQHPVRIGAGFLVWPAELGLKVLFHENVALLGAISEPQFIYDDFDRGRGRKREQGTRESEEAAADERRNDDGRRGQSGGRS